MKFSLSLVPIVDRADRQPLRRTIAQCRVAEELGFDTVMVGHHHFAAGSVSDPFSLLAALASVTTHIRLATAVFLLPLHHPIEVAERVATLDQISGGRVTLGVGIGWDPHEYAAFGASVTERGARLEEAITQIRALWARTDVAAGGRFWSYPAVTVQPAPVQIPSPPIWVAGNAARAIDRAARLGDAWLCDPIQRRSRVADLLELYREACRRAGRRPSWVLRRYVWLGESRRAMEEEWLPGFVAGQLAYWRRSAEGDDERRLVARLDAGEALTPQDIARERFLGGTVEDVVTELDTYRELGCEHLSVGFGGGLSGRPASDVDERYAEVMTMIERFGEEVIPAFA